MDSLPAWTYFWPPGFSQTNIFLLGLTVHNNFTLAIFFSLFILGPFMLCQSTDSNTPLHIHVFYKIIGLKEHTNHP